jgi:hypothetical protein
MGPKGEEGRAGDEGPRGLRFWLLIFPIKYSFIIYGF